MKKQSGRVVRQGSIYHVTVDGIDHALFIWQSGKRFSGRVEGKPQIPEHTGSSALAVCTLLTKRLATETVDTVV